MNTHNAGKNLHVAFNEWLEKNEGKLQLSKCSTQEQFQNLLREAFFQGDNVGYSNGIRAYPLWNARPLPRATTA